MLNAVVILFLGAGILFFVGGSIGLIRFPDFYTRLHAAGKLDTMGLLTAMLSMALYALHDFSWGEVLTGLKIMLIVVFVFITSPTATHAIVDAARRAGLEPWTKAFPEKPQ
ncbi:MAG: monovalent cation/H(+) antiporter subunit G [Desulfobacterales bacterium]|jgi:multicomponent Na+:H+ antiporter subunit G|nr:monovalent cation/H(+) antiporter subunit G [Desulfobacterales bacterium]